MSSASYGTSRPTRRGLLASAAGLVLLPDARSVRTYQANEKIGVALIGCGGRGEWFVDTIPGLERIVAMCDVNDERAAKSYGKLPDVPRHKDFRRMLDVSGKQIDAVVVAAPDHIHAPASMMAMKMGKPVFCEKPLAHDIAEARAMRSAAARLKAITQMGNQGTASEAFRRCCELVWAGVIGEVRKVYAWNESGGSGLRERPKGEQPVPATLAWDLFLGPVPFRPYHPDWMNWHAWREFATGQLGNWASHTMNLPFKALRLDTLWDPGSRKTFRVRAEIGETTPHTFPRWEVLTYEFPERAGMPPVSITWVNGGAAPRGRREIEDLLGRKLDWGDAGEKKWADYAGCLLVGSKGMIHSTGHNMSYKLLPEERFRGFEGPPQTLPRVPGPEVEWFRAIRGQGATMSSFEYAGRLAEFTLIGNVATLYPPEIVYQAAQGKVVSPSAANAALKREYRAGWEVLLTG